MSNDLARARRLVAARKAIYTYMKSHGDFTDADINKAHGELAFAQVTLDQLTSANEQTNAIKALADEIKRSNDFASAVHNVALGKLARSLADIIGDQIVGRGYKPREDDEDDEDDGLAGSPVRA